jgi:hypothetical protein
MPDNNRHWKRMSDAGTERTARKCDFSAVSPKMRELWTPQVVPKSRFAGFRPENNLCRLRLPRFIFEIRIFRLFTVTAPALRHGRALAGYGFQFKSASKTANRRQRPGSDNDIVVVKMLPRQAALGIGTI